MKDIPWAEDQAKYRGMDVAVKVNRPNIERVLKKDLIVINRLLKLVKVCVEVSQSTECQSYKVLKKRA